MLSLQSQENCAVAVDDVQDFFDSRILAMDTDFRMFSAQHHGNLPGIDLAYILDGAAYHTKQDTVARIRKGTVQVDFNLPPLNPHCSITSQDKEGK